MTRIHQRVIGNVLGGAGAAFFLVVLPGPYAQTIVLGGAAFLCFAARPINYGLYAIPGAIVILMLTDVGHPQSAWVAAIRVGATIVGAALAVAGARWILPRWAGSEAIEKIEYALRADVDYARSISQGYRGHYDMEYVTQGRRKADSASAAAYSVLDQMRFEPVTGSDELAFTEGAVRVSTHLRDCLIALAADIPKAGISPALTYLSVAARIDESISATEAVIDGLTAEHSQSARDVNIDKLSETLASLKSEVERNAERSS